MKTKTITLYSFDELSEESKEKAINNLSTINVDFEWWESIYEDAQRIGLKITGFDLDRHRHATGNFIESATECADKILKEHGKECETYKTAKQFISDRDSLVAKYSDGIEKDKVEEGKEFEFDKECDELENEFLRSLLEDYSLMLQKESEYLQSREAIEETIKANECFFTESGDLE